MDLNRNFPSPVDGLVDYEPETLAQMHFMQSVHLVLAANIHDGEEVFNYPWDTWSRLHADDNWYIRAGRKYADTVQIRAVPELYMSGFNDGITNGYQWYDIIGGRQDYVNYFLHAREVTLELNRYKHPAADYLPFLWYYNYPALLQYMENSLFGIHGIVLDAVTGQPVKARIAVPDHDMDESHVFSDSANGYFARLIEAGTWTLEFTAEGYEMKTIPGILVEWDRATDLMVQMDPVSEGTHQYGQLEAWPNPWITKASIRFQVSVPGLHRVILTGMDGRILMQDNITCPAPGYYVYELNSHGIEPGWYILHLRSPEGIFSVKLLRSE